MSDARHPIEIPAELPLDRERVPPVPVEEWDPEVLAFVQRALRSDEEPLNFYKPLVHHPKLMEKWTVFAGRLLGKGILDPRDRELVILRTLWLCRSTYEWVHHVEIAGEAGLTTDEVDAVRVGAEADGWRPRDAALLRAADELHRDCVVGDRTFEALAEHFGHADLVEIVMLAGQYHLVTYYTRTFGVQLEDELAARVAFRPDP